MLPTPLHGGGALFRLLAHDANDAADLNDDDNAGCWKSDCQTRPRLRVLCGISWNLPLFSGVGTIIRINRESITVGVGIICLLAECGGYVKHFWKASLYVGVRHCVVK